ncbi:cellulase family glycosylhydrolase [Aquimarina sp. ERC-38]|uniref:cellulase family glycosylhydrolase n=1 Tax=Aquimarina sp. ERC-38 TaxID=2949996 RepID=UPI00224623AB|nr:cellulase family glycosylhydrolase [Aquimarina sp. ERC-38]UZO81929.1 cellulase family glycosylhydrolase [Aquimarina sp. ERC-38]
MKKLLFLKVLFCLFLLSEITAQNTCSGNWLSVQGNKLLDSNDNEVILSGVNWFGFETSQNLLHGLWARDLKSVLYQSKELGFNCFRIPWHNLMLRDGVETYKPNLWVQDLLTNNGETGPYSNLYLEGKRKPIEVLDEIIKWCQENDMKVILDCHSRNPDGYLAEGLWYTNTVSEDEWIADWVFMADRYKDYDAVIGMDINNEPHGKIDDPEGARWGNGDPATDWRLAAEKCGNAILKANPNVLIIVEGIEAYNKPDGTETSYWWGGNLQGARDYPIRISDMSKLMYSPHEYGPTVYAQKWFDVPEFPDNMPDIWEEQFNFLNTNGTSPLFVGELGIKTRQGKDEVWFAKFIDFIKTQKLHFAFWSLNPNSGDTGGILADGWFDVVDWKMEYLKPLLFDLIPNCSASSTLTVNEIGIDAGSEFAIYPNPVEDILSINNNPKDAIKRIIIRDVNGKVIYTINTKGSQSNTYKQKVTDLTPGMYIANIITANGEYQIKKFIKK